MCFSRVRYRDFNLYSACSSRSDEKHLTSTDYHSIHIVYVLAENLQALSVCNFDVTF